ncbi:hypothetical protein CICLE_v10004386mg [Citrus x clementina]|uniref:non-specific serine/threonine protein kinase n=1 Tax=Citrus clementina TaxID=85681 RepID=V4S2Y9_CITCL|nr:hypothetical protein CICLE_v10004386mg [Citrus x clementina]
MDRSNSLRMITVSFIQSLLLCLLVASAAASNISTDQQALLFFKDHITYDPTNVLAQNWTSNTSVCNWIGISCDVNSRRVTALDISSFGLQGTIPPQLGNLSSLQTLNLDHNKLSGNIPSSIFTMSSLKFLGLGPNNLKSSTPELSFLSSLTNCKKLIGLILTGNPVLDGILPKSIGNLSLSLKTIHMSNCSIRGNIPQVISNLSNLLVLELGGNKLTGPIPVTFGQLHTLQGLGLSTNKLAGSIPDEICHLGRLNTLILAVNRFSGSIPSCLGNLTSLRDLYLAYNKLTSVIPSTFWTLKDILIFDFSSNSLDGPLSLDIRNLEAVVEIDLSRNNLSGDIPTTIGSLIHLQRMTLAFNRLEGPIPESFGDLISLEILDLSSNKISGFIPTSMEKLLPLKELNLSFNKLEGEIPRGGPFANFTVESFVGNELLCGSPNLQLPPCKLSTPRTQRKSRKQMLLLVIVLPLCTTLILVVALALKCKLIECGKRSTIARLEDGMEIAIKVFHQHCTRALKSFEVECEVMKNIRHRNLVKVISSCSNNDFKALVLEYMPNGSLEDRLHSSNCMLNIFHRLSIMIDVALALEYLHFGHSTPIVHCDLKPSNVLLDEDMVAHLSDFGISKLLSRDDQFVMRTQTLATIGYMAPEYGVDGQVSVKSDVYSYGIMLMETFTKKKPTDEIFVAELSLKRWVNDLLPVSLMEVMDINLLIGDERHFAAKEQCVLSILRLALECAVQSPEERINAKDIVTRLWKIRDKFTKKLANLN